MAGIKIPETDHVARLCGMTKCDENGVPAGTAFMLKEDEEYLSVNWLEKTEGASRTEQLSIVRQHLKAKGMKLGAMAKLAVLHIGAAVNHVRHKSPDSQSLSVYYEPLPNDPSHAGIYGYTAEDDLIADLIAGIVREIYPAKETN